MMDKELFKLNLIRLNHTSGGLGLKNIQSRVKVLKGRIFFEIDTSHTYYKVTIEVPKEPVDINF